MADQTTRRGLLKLAPALGLAALLDGQSFPRAGEFVRFSDPTTEASVVRLTNPAYRSVLPKSTNRIILSRPRVLLCSSDRVTGRMVPCQIDLRTGLVRPVTEASALDPASLAVDATGRTLYFLDGGALSEAPINSRREKRKPEVLVRNVTAFGVGAGRSELFFITEGKLYQFQKQGQRVIAAAAGGFCLVRPGGRGCLFGRPGEFWYAPAGGADKPLRVAAGRISQPHWSADGTSVLFLRDIPVNQVFVSTICEVPLASLTEHCVAKTTQFAAFTPNGNDSVFVGASASKAQPNIVLLLRLTGRELTLCEHRASQPSEVRPLFSPDSRRVFFQSDREGKSVIYGVNVDKLVEETSEPA